MSAARHPQIGGLSMAGWLGSIGALALLLATGCSTSRGCLDSTRVDDELLARTSHVRDCVSPCRFVLPPDVVLEDGVTEDEAVATALSNNSAFQATLSQLEMARGDLIQAGLLTNPNLTTFLPVSVKQWEWTLYAPIEAFVLRPHRLGIAQSDYERVANQLVQNGLTLVRDVRVAHADLGVALQRRQLAQEAITIRRGIATLTQKRLNRGEISELESISARIDASNAEATAALLEQDIAVARSRLAMLMGLPPDRESLETTLAKPASLAELDVQALIAEALASRPDVQAAQWAVDVASQRRQLARWLFLRVDTVADANGRGIKGFEIGPGIRFDIPIFNRNQGGVIRSTAELTQALHNRDAIQDQIVQEVRAAAAQWTQARNNLAILENEVAPSLEDTLHIAEKGFAAGGTDYLLVLQTTTQYLDAKTRMLDQKAALRRARAELERAVGKHLEEAPEELPAPLPPVDLVPAPFEESE